MTKTKYSQPQNRESKSGHSKYEETEGYEYNCKNVCEDSENKRELKETIAGLHSAGRCVHFEVTKTCAEPSIVSIQEHVDPSASEPSQLQHRAASGKNSSNDEK